MNITGTIVNYFFHCKRQCWLFANRINLEDNSEDVHIGKIIHELKAQDNANSELAIDNIKVDKLTDKYLVEIKKSDSDIEAVKWQTLFYMKKLKGKGIDRLGRIEFDEKNKQDKKVITLELTGDIEKELEKAIEEIDILIEEEHPPEAVREQKCRKCAYYEYCFL